MVQVQTAVLQLGSCLQQYARDISAIRQHLEQEFVDMAKQCPDELAEVPTPLECLDRLTHLQLTLAEVQQLETQLAQKRSEWSAKVQAQVSQLQGQLSQVEKQTGLTFQSTQSQSMQ